MLTQRLTIREIPKLRKSAKNAPVCFVCGKVNDGTLVLMHSNELQHGRGFGFKTPDYMGAIGCYECHMKIDGQWADLSKEEKREMHRRAHEKTLTWWFETGLLE